MAEYRVRQLRTRVGDDLHVKDSKATRGSKSNCYYCGPVSNHVLLPETRTIACNYSYFVITGQQISATYSMIRSLQNAVSRRPADPSIMVVPDAAGLSRLDEGLFADLQIAIGTFRGPCRAHNCRDGCVRQNSVKA